MTDNEIIKALENEVRLTEYVDSNYCDSIDLSLIKSALNLITQQQAEIDELKHEREVLIEDIHYSADKINEQLEEIERLKYNLKSVLDERADHTDAIKEFAERLKLSFFNNGYESPDVDFDYFIDNLVKEYEEGR